MALHEGSMTAQWCNVGGIGMGGQQEVRSLLCAAKTPPYYWEHTRHTRKKTATVTTPQKSHLQYNAVFKYITCKGHDQHVGALVAG